MSSHLIVLIRFYYYLIALINLLLEQAKQVWFILQTSFVK